MTTAITNIANKNQKTLVFTAGLPGAGKSTVIKNTEFKYFPVVDPDAFKVVHPDYDPKNPSLVHEWSATMARRMHLRLLSDNMDFVVDGTGTNVEKYLGFFNEARELGYKVVVLYVRVKVATSIERNAKRDRSVPVEVILEKAGVIEQSMNLLGSVADEYIVIDND